MTPPPRLLALDPSLAACGWAVVEIGVSPRLLAAGVIETAPTPAAKRKALGLSVAEDDGRRVRYLRRELIAVLGRHGPAIVASEAAAGSTNAKGAAQSAAAHAVAACVVDEQLGGAQIVYLSAAAAGEALGLKRTQRRTQGATEKAPEASEPKVLERQLAKLRKLPRAAETDARIAELEVELTQAKELQRVANRQRAASRKARKGSIANVVVERFGAAAWAGALGIRQPEDDEVVLHTRWEGAHDAAAVALAAWERPEVAAVRARWRQTLIPGTEIGARA